MGITFDEEEVEEALAVLPGLGPPFLTSAARREGWMDWSKSEPSSPEAAVDVESSSFRFFFFAVSKTGSFGDETVLVGLLVRMGDCVRLLVPSDPTD